MYWLFWQIVFEGIAGKSYQGDIAIDDLKLIKSPCPLPGDYFELLNFEYRVNNASYIIKHSSFVFIKCLASS